MPYITKDRRKAIFEYFPGSSGGGTEPPEPATWYVAGQEIEKPGELNYAITELCLKYIEEQLGHSYTSYNEVIGVLECAKLELYRRLAAPYEDDKIEDNGDVY